MSRTAWLLLAALLLLVGLGGPAAADDGDGDAPAAEAPSAEVELAQRYAPVMMLVAQDEACGPGEPYDPSDVDPLFDESSIALRGPWATRDLVDVAPSVDELAAGLEGYALDMPGDPLKPGCDYETWAKRLWGKGATPTIYAHVATQSGVEDRIALQYFFFYPFNDYNNKHEADWERIQVELPAGSAEEALDVDPDVVLYSQHYGAERAAWGDTKLQVDDTTHPVVYVSAGSHASQYDEGVYLGRSATEGFGCDSTVGPYREVRPEVRTIPSDPALAAEAFPWTTYRGHWGEVRSQRFYEGPTGPNMKQAWRKPFTWSAKARDDAFSLPGAEAAGNEASQAFCTLVSSGSDGFRRLSADPGPTLLVLAVVLGALVWLVRRSLRGHVGAPLVTVRGPLQVIGAAVRTLGAHGRTFLAVAAPAAVVSVVSSVVTTLASSDSAGVWAVLGAVELVVLVAALAWAQLATAQAVADIDAGRHPTLASLVRDTRARGRAFATTAGWWALVVVPMTLTGVLAPVALVVALAWALVLPVVQLEGLSGRAALGRSWRLVRRRPLVVLAVVAVSVLVVSTLGGVLATLVFITLPAPFVVVSAVPPLVTALVWPLTALLTTYAWGDAVAASGTTSSASLGGGEPATV